MGACALRSQKEEDQLAASREIELELKRMRRDDERKARARVLAAEALTRLDQTAPARHGRQWKEHLLQADAHHAQGLLAYRVREAQGARIAPHPPLTRLVDIAGELPVDHAEASAGLPGAPQGTHASCVEFAIAHCSTLMTASGCFCARFGRFSRHRARGG